MWLEVPISTLGAGRLLCRDDNNNTASQPSDAQKQHGGPVLTAFGGPQGTSRLTPLLFYLPGLQQLMKTDDDEQAKTRQEDVHEDPEEEREKQKNQDHSGQDGEKEDGKRVNARLSVQAVFFLCDGHRLVEDGVLEHVPLDKHRRAHHVSKLGGSAFPSTLPRHACTHGAVLVVEVDHQPERPPPHRLGGDEGVLEGGLSRRRNHGSQLESSEVLDVELVILKGSTQEEGQRSKVSCGSGRRSRSSFFT